MHELHCSDERLLAWLDGEDKRLIRWRTWLHLRRCWQCRARLLELEQQAAALARAGRSERDRWAARAEAARQAFLARVESEPAPAPGPSLAARWWMLPATAAAGALLVVGGYGVWQQAAAPPSEPLSAPRWQFVPPPPKAPLFPYAPLAAPRPAPPPLVSPLPARIPHGLLAEAELEALSVLRAYPSPGLTSFTFERSETAGLLLQGVAESAQQRALLLGDLSAAIHSAPWRARILIPEETAPPAPLEAASRPETAALPPKPAALPLLLEAFSADFPPAEANARANDAANQVIRLAASAWTSAWTLRRLAQRFPDSTVLELSARGRTTLAHLVAAETASLRNALLEMQEALPVRSSADEAVQTGQLWTTVERVERLAHALMAAGEPHFQDPRRAMLELVSLLNGLGQLLAGPAVESAFWPSLNSQASPAASLRR